ncbi:MAG: T9SS type A sorting domain-containing protein [Bacteroidia bacterium]
MQKYLLLLLLLSGFSVFGQTNINTGTSIQIAAGTEISFTETNPQNLTLQVGSAIENNRTIVLGNNVALKEPNHFSISGNGIITATRNINSSINTLNFAGMGLSISTSMILGQTTVQRGHVIQTGNGNQSIKRYYDILVANNVGLNAELAFNYNDSTELNGLPEAGLKMFHSNDLGNNWLLQSSNVDITNHTVSANGFNNLNGRYTLATDLSTGIDEIKNKHHAANSFNLMAYPNPFYDHIDLMIDSKNPLQITVYDAVGKMVFNKTFYNKNETIYLNNLMLGVYYMYANNGETQQTIKLIKQ